MNLVVLKGNVASDIESKEVNANGRTTTVVNFRLAVNRFFKKSDQTRDKDTTFVSCEAWDTGAETIKKYLEKGDPVLINGSLKSESWEQDGQKRSRIKVRVNNFERLFRAPPSSAVEDTEKDSVSEIADKVTANANGEDIPF